MDSDSSGLNRGDDFDVLDPCNGTTKTQHPYQNIPTTNVDIIIEIFNGDQHEIAGKIVQELLISGMEKLEGFNAGNL